MLHTTPIPPVAIHEVVKPEPEPVVVTEEPVVRTRQPTPELPLLHELLELDRLLITKKLRVRNVVFLKGRRNRYLVKTSDQALIYTVEEENSWWAGYFCYGLRPLQLRVLNDQGAEVMRIHRPYACTGRCLPCQLQHLEVYSKGQRLGSVEQQWTPVKPLYLVKNDNGDHLFWIRGPLMTLSCFRDVQFEILRHDGAPVGATCKRWQGLMHALFYAPVVDNFGVAFEQDLSVEEKGLLLAATLLMDYMYYDV
ncbi:hypothetical protein PYW07_011196 [Mythimna separata]|uniref:Phospholipid scramblase n=1 Tax=Mythimna separata TaxID=271217 RepID=A0AAD7Y7T5_MYTSE|nr:hypothetical protein PYW07_011196 [Mythimna separata]